MVQERSTIEYSRQSQQPEVDKVPAVRRKIPKSQVFVFLVPLACLVYFLSVIFGILGKFWIDIGVQKKFRRSVLTPICKARLLCVATAKCLGCPPPSSSRYRWRGDCDATAVRRTGSIRVGVHPSGHPTLISRHGLYNFT